MDPFGCLSCLYLVLSKTRSKSISLYLVIIKRHDCDGTSFVLFF